jgi:hypothetical protein
MKIINSLFAGLLFFLLTPNVLLRLPKNGSKITVAILHAIVFSVILYFYQVFIDYLLNNQKQGFTDDKCTQGTNDDDGPYILPDENDPTSCKLKNID